MNTYCRVKRYRKAHTEDLCFQWPLKLPTGQQWLISLISYYGWNLLWAMINDHWSLRAENRKELKISHWKTKEFRDQWLDFLIYKWKWKTDIWGKLKSHKILLVEVKFCFNRISIECYRVTVNRFTVNRATINRVTVNRVMVNRINLTYMARGRWSLLVISLVQDLSSLPPLSPPVLEPDLGNIR